MAAEKMDAEKKAKWVAGLRSGKYAQGRGSLFIAGRYCCLGVYGRICGLADDVMLGRGGIFIVDDLPGLEDIPGHARPALAEMNDGGKTFPEIADFIERTL